MAVCHQHRIAADACPRAVVVEFQIADEALFVPIQREDGFEFAVFDGELREIFVGDDLAGEAAGGAEIVQPFEFSRIQFEFRALDEKSQPVERQDSREPPVFEIAADPVAAAPRDEGKLLRFENALVRNHDFGDDGRLAVRLLCAEGYLQRRQMDIDLCAAAGRQHA